MSKYDAVYFVGDNQAINGVKSRFFQNEELSRIFGLACSPNHIPIFYVIISKI